MGNTPNVRFKGFTEDWEQRKVSEIAIEKLSNGIMNNQSDDETGVKHINVINMYDTDKIHPEKLTFSNYDEEAVKKCNVEFGDIFLTRSSLKPEGIAEANVLLDSGRFVYDDHLIRLKVNKEKYDSFFVKLNLSGNAFKRQFIVRAKTTAFTTIGQEDISECLGFFPKKEEQQQISEYFMILDQLITLHQQKCDETKEFKKYMLQNMFPQKDEKVPKIRFDGFTGDWEQRKFDDLADYKKGPFGSALKKDMFVPKSDMTVKVYEQQNAINKDWHLERYFITEEYANKLSGFRVEGGDIIVSCAGTIGETYEIPLDAEPGIINQALMRIKVKESIVNKKMFNILFTNMIDDFTRVHSNGSAIKNIPPFSDLKPMVVFVPKMDEQNKISSYFSNLDHLITLHQQKCNALKEFKKYMLQNMFPQKGENKCQN